MHLSERGHSKILFIKNVLNIRAVTNNYQVFVSIMSLYVLSFVFCQFPWTEAGPSWTAVRENCWRKSENWDRSWRPEPERAALPPHSLSTHCPLSPSDHKLLSVFIVSEIHIFVSSELELQKQRLRLRSIPASCYLFPNAYIPSFPSSTNY